MANNVIKRLWNQNRIVTIEDLKGMTFQQEVSGHTFEITGVDDAGNIIALSGTPSGVLLRADDQEVALTCSVSDGKVYATIPANGYAVPGKFGLTVFLTASGQTTALYAAIGSVNRTASGVVAPPAGSDVVTLVNQINAAIAAIPVNYNASFAPAYSTSGLYAVGQYVTQNGGLYRCITPVTTAGTWEANSSKFTAATLGNDLSDLKSALSEESYNAEFANVSLVVDGSPFATQPGLVKGYVKYATGEIISNPNGDAYYMRTNYIQIPAKCSKIQHNFVFIEGSAGYAFFTVKKEYISGGNTGVEISTIPQTAAYFMITDYSISQIHTGKTIAFYADYAMATIGDIEAIKNAEEEIITPELVDGYVNYSTYAISDSSLGGYYKRTGYVEIPEGCDKIKHNFEFSGSAGYAFFNDEKIGIGGGNTTGVISSIPSAAAYIMITNYSASQQHTGKTITFAYSFSSLKSLQNQIDDISGNSHESNITNLVTYGDSHVAYGLWQQAVIDYFGIESHTNLGIGSSTVAENASATVPCFVNADRIAAIESANPDTIIIIGGTNDVHLDTPLGSESQLSLATSSKDKTTFYGAYGYLIETLLAWKPTLQIIICTTPQGTYDQYNHAVTYEEISEVIKKIAFHYSLPVADIFGKAGINKTNLSTYSNDEIHYNATGNVRVSDLIIATIRDCYIGFKH